VAKVKLDPALSGSAANLVRLGCSLMASRKGGQAVAIVGRVLEEHPGDPMWREAGRAILSQGVPGYHRSMLADSARNHAYARAIRETVSPGDTVLDIGAGSGLLAMMAAKAGARKVVACEANPALAATAAEIVRRNGFDGVVEVVAEHSTRLERSGKLGDGADVIVAEIFSHTLIDEGAIRALNHGIKVLAKPGARIVPASASVRVALVDYTGDVLPPLGRVAGFDLSPFERHLPSEIAVPVKSRHLHLRSPPRSLFDFDFSRGEAPSERRTELILTSLGGPVTGVVQWIALQLTGNVAFENAPDPDRRSHWPCVVHPFDEPLATSAGEEVRIGGWHDDLRLLIWR
jgi:type II protein arginine methyltransferase